MEIEYETHRTHPNSTFAVGYQKQQQQQLNPSTRKQVQRSREQHQVQEDQRQDEFSRIEPERAWHNFTETVHSIGEFILDLQLQPCMDCSRMEPEAEPPIFHLTNILATQPAGENNGNVQPLYMSTSMSSNALFPSLHLDDSCECKGLDDDVSEDEMDLQVHQSPAIFGTSCGVRTRQPLSFQSIAQNAGNTTFAKQQLKPSIYRYKGATATCAAFPVFPGLSRSNNVDLYRSPAWEDEDGVDDHDVSENSDEISVEYDSSNVKSPRTTVDGAVGTANMVINLNDVDDMFQGFSIKSN